MRPPRFGLIWLFALVTAVGIALTLWQFVGPAWGLSLLLIGLVVLAHVAGNALGSRLRDGTRDVAVRPGPSTAGPQWGAAGGAQAMERATDHFAPVTRLSHFAPLGHRPYWAAGLGACVGGLAGCYCLRWSYGSAATVTTLAVGGLAVAALGGLFTFWLCSLLQVLGAAWWQAHRHSERRD